MIFKLAKSLSRSIFLSLIAFTLISKCASPAMAQAQAGEPALSQETARGIALFNAGDTAGAIGLLLKAVKQNADEKAIAQAPQDADADEWRERLESLHVWKSIILSGDEALIKQQIVRQKDLTVAARPLNYPKFDYPEDLRQAGIKGEVLLYAVISEDGRVQSTLALRALHPALTQQALTAARQQRFEPAQKDGKPVKKIVMLKYNFDSVSDKK
jgi:TonB family protein